MNNKIANIIVDYLKDLTWVDKLAGMTQVARISQVKGETTVEKRFPISCQMSFDEVCKKGCYDDLAPNSTYQSLIYFEDGTFRFNRQQGKKLYYDSSMRLICWLNYKKMVGGCGSSGDYVIDIIKALPSVPINVGDMLGLNIRVVSQMARSSAIFGAYTYNEKQTQYLMLPYDYFALDISTSFHVITECLTVEPSGCLEC